MALLGSLVQNVVPRSVAVLPASSTRGRSVVCLGAAGGVALSRSPKRHFREDLTSWGWIGRTRPGRAFREERACDARYIDIQSESACRVDRSACTVVTRQCRRPTTRDFVIANERNSHLPRRSYNPHAHPAALTHAPRRIQRRSPTSAWRHTSCRATQAPGGYGWRPSRPFRPSHPPRPSHREAAATPAGP